MAFIPIIQLEATQAITTTITRFAASSMTVFVNELAITLAAVDENRGHDNSSECKACQCKTLGHTAQLF